MCWTWQKSWLRTKRTSWLGNVSPSSSICDSSDFRGDPSSTCLTSFKESLDTFGVLTVVQDRLESLDVGVLGGVEAEPLGETVEVPYEGRGSLALREFITSLTAWAYNLPTWAQPSANSQWEQLEPQSSCRARSRSTDRRSSHENLLRSSRGRKSTYSSEKGTWRRPEAISSLRAPSSRLHWETEQQGRAWVRATSRPLLNMPTWSGRRWSRERRDSMVDRRESDKEQHSIQARRPVPWLYWGRSRPDHSCTARRQDHKHMLAGITGHRMKEK